ncbi:MAG: TRAP transporter fused permease subunit [Pseudomonadota bacterium]|nr:TRAP transporter fused permease subunit [Pseudomonadota bacterium]
MIDKICSLTLRVFLALIPFIGILWIFSVPDYFQLGLLTAQVIVIVFALANGAIFLKYPYQKKAGIFELSLAFCSLIVWVWMSWNLEEWLLRMAERPAEMWVPGIIALVLMLEGIRKATGKVIAGLVATILLYGYFGNYLPGPLEASVFPPTKTVVYLYADHNGIPGLVLQIITELVLAFIIFGKMMEVSGAMAFLNDLSLGIMGHRRGGPAKVAVVASSAFGSISGSTVANIMSTGIVTIPMMKKTGFQSKYAAAIEAVASNGGQIAPPVMGATAFIIAEFLEVPYGDVVIAALLPAIIYFYVLFLQVDGVAARFGLEGIPKNELPKIGKVLFSGWPYLIPLAVMIYFLIGLGYRAGLSGMYACGILLVLMILKNRRFPSRHEWSRFFVEGGENLLPLLMIGGGAGVIIGLMNSTGLGFQLSLALTTIAENAGVFVMLLMTAFICIILGMGMPTAAVYVVLVSIVAPALVEMKIPELSAHMFIFYFGLLSMLTPPVAVASMVAAEIAESDMWQTGLLGLQLAVAAFLMPFLWAFNPAMLLQGSWLSIFLVVATILPAGLLIGQMSRLVSNELKEKIIGFGLLVIAILIGSATIWIGPEDLLVLIPVSVGFIIYFGAIKVKNTPLTKEPYSD